MAKQVLPVNFKDDILASSMGGKRRYNLIQNDDGTYSLEDVTDYTQTGSDFGAGQINATNQAVNESCDKANVIETMDDIVSNQASGMIAGAKAVAELNGNLKAYETDNNGAWTVVKHPNRWTELHITAMIPRASTETYSLALNFPDGIRLRNAQTFITPARNGWNVANYYHNNDNQDSQTAYIDHTNLVFSAKTAQSLTHYFEVVVCGFEA